MRTAIVGMGRMGVRHLAVARAMGLELVGVCDRSEKALQTASDEHGLPPEACFQDFEALLAKRSPECVIVATTAPAHRGLTIAAANAGARYILCEKPMAQSLDECDQMAEACEALGVKLAINHPRRHLPVYQEIRRVLHSEAFGPWASMAVIGGNVGLAMNGTHYVELFHWLAGERIDMVTAWLSDERLPNPRGEEFEDAGGSLRATTPSGRRLHLELGADQGLGLHCTYAGRNGLLHRDEIGGSATLVVREQQHRSRPTALYALPSHSRELESRPADAQAAARAVLSQLLGSDDFPGAPDGRAALAVVIAAHVSHENGNVPVAVGPELPSARRFPFG